MYHLYLFISIFKYKTKDKGGGRAAFYRMLKICKQKYDKLLHIQIYTTIIV